VFQELFCKPGASYCIRLNFFCAPCRTNYLDNLEWDTGLGLNALQLFDTEVRYSNAPDQTLVMNKRRGRAQEQPQISHSLIVPACSLCVIRCY